MPGELRFCPSCGARNEPEAAFCGKCGHALNVLIGPNAAQQPGVAVPPVQPGGFDVILRRIGGKKIQVIKVCRGVTGLDLAAVKTLVESAPVAIKTNVSQRDAEQIKAWLDALGATLEVRPTGTFQPAASRPALEPAAQEPSARERSFCPNCGARNEPDAAFCGECGRPVHAAVRRGS